MKLEIGMYMRTIYGTIDKIFKITESYVQGVSQKDTYYIYDKDNIIKTSYNIIDILEKGDYVNGSEVLDFENKYIKEDDKFVPIGVITENCYLDYTDSWILEKNIKTITTHEQMERMTYKVEE